MTAESLSLGQILTTRRVELEVEPSELADQLILGQGWVEAIESGKIEPPLELLVRWADALEKSLSELLQDLDGSRTRRDVGIVAEQSADDLNLRFQYGQYLATWTLPSTTLGTWQSYVRYFRDQMSNSQKAGESVAESLLRATTVWPEANPSDFWYFIIPKLYQDPFNHPASFAVGKDLAQSWKRTSGWALELVVASRYKSVLEEHGLELLAGDTKRKKHLLERLSLGDRIDVAKADIVVVANAGEPSEEAIGVLHVKASLAERRNADEAMSAALIGRGYISSFVTMDSKGSPSEKPDNRGELGATKSSNGEVRSAKRLEIEEQRMFDGFFSFNLNTIPTPQSQTAAARVHVCAFEDAEDALFRHIVTTWSRLRGDA